MWPFLYAFSSTPTLCGSFVAFAFSSPSDGALHDTEGLVPRETVETSGSFHCLALLERVDHMALHQGCEPGRSLCPRGLDLANPVLWTLHSRQPRMNPRLVFEQVSMPPSPFSSVVVAGQFLIAIWTLPLGPFLVLKPDMHFFRLFVDIDVMDAPRGYEREDGF